MNDLFHPLVERWFTERFHQPTPAQAAGWQSIAAGEATLIAAPTGSGKTLAAFLWSIDRLIKQALGGALQERTSVVYVSPLKALGNDIAKNLQAPLAEIYQLAGREGILLPTIRVAVRSGDTPAHERQAMVRRPPHILITTPESLYILLTAARSREFLRTAETLIVDEIHAIAQDKRGAHLALVARAAGSLGAAPAAAHRLERDAETDRRSGAAAWSGRDRFAMMARLIVRSSMSAISARWNCASKCRMKSWDRSFARIFGRRFTTSSSSKSKRTARLWCSSTRAAWSSGWRTS